MRKYILFAFISGLALGCATISQTKRVVHDSVVLAEDACVVLQDVDPQSQKTREICARSEELKKLIDLLLQARKRQVQDAAAE